MSARDDNVDIKRLLALALDEPPPPGLDERIMTRLAGVTTLVELGRLLGVASTTWLHHDDKDDDAMNVEYRPATAGAVRAGPEMNGDDDD